MSLKYCINHDGKKFGLHIKPQGKEKRQGMNYSLCYTGEDLYLNAMSLIVYLRLINYLKTFFTFASDVDCFILPTQRAGDIFCWYWSDSIFPLSVQKQFYVWASRGGQWKTEHWQHSIHTCKVHKQGESTQKQTNTHTENAHSAHLWCSIQSMLQNVGFICWGLEENISQ